MEYKYNLVYNPYLIYPIPNSSEEWFYQDNNIFSDGYILDYSPYGDIIVDSSVPNDLPNRTTNRAHSLNIPLAVSHHSDVLMTNMLLNARPVKSVIPYILGDNYLIETWAYSSTTDAGLTGYFCLLPYDNKGNFIHVNETNVRSNNGQACVGELVNTLLPNDTAVEVKVLNSSFTIGNYSYLAIMESPAYKDNRAIFVPAVKINKINEPYNGILGIKFEGSGWPSNGGIWNTSTRVAIVDDSDTFMYPFGGFDTNSLPANTWRQFSVNQPMNDLDLRCNRLPSTYFLGIATCGGRQLNLTGMNIENLSRNQMRIPEYSQEGITSVDKYGQINSELLAEGFIPVRYIKDYIYGSDHNKYNHWVEILAYDMFGRNVAFAANGIVDDHITVSGNYASLARYTLNWTNSNYNKMHVITNEDTTCNAYFDVDRDTVESIMIDLGTIHYINKIKIWHYWADGRTYYNSRTAVSINGNELITVFDSNVQGTYVETKEGHTITFENILQNNESYLSNIVKFKQGGQTLVKDVIEQ